VLLACFCVACTSSPPTHRAWASAEAAATQGDWPRAADLWYEIHLAERVKTPRPYMETARALYRSGLSESACEMFRDGLRAFPRHVGLLELYAEVLEELGYQRRAELYYSRLVDVAPDDPDAWLGLARVRLGLGDEHAAEAPLQRVLLLRPDSAEAHAHLARVSEVFGDTPRAFDHYERAIDLGADDLGLLLDAGAVSIDVAVLESRSQAGERGLEWVGAVIEVDPQSTCAHYLRAVHLEMRDDLQGALVAYLRAVETDPSCVQALTRLAEVYSQVGDRTRMAEMVARALDIEQDPQRRQVLENLLAD